MAGKEETDRLIQAHINMGFRTFILPLFMAKRIQKEVEEQIREEKLNSNIPDVDFIFWNNDFENAWTEPGGCDSTWPFGFYGENADKFCSHNHKIIFERLFIYYALNSLEIELGYWETFRKKSSSAFPKSLKEWGI